MVGSSPLLHLLVLLLALASSTAAATTTAGVGDSMRAEDHITALLAAVPPLNDDVLGLIVFKSGLADPSSALSSWDEDDDSPCAAPWAHVRCDPAAGRVVELVLVGLGLSGRVGRGLEKLQRLESLSLAGNNFSGQIPPQLALLPSLRSLNLSGNALSGHLPPELRHMPALRSLDLSGNAFAGPIPGDALFGGSAPFCTSLRYLSLASNSLSGPIPPSLSQCTLLSYLNLSGNLLSGDPDFAGVFYHLNRLRVLDLSRNDLTGPVPEGIAGLHSLKAFHLASNRFAGSIPAGVGLCPHLTSLDLCGNAFTGPLPYTMQWLGSLSHLDLSGNQISGDLPPWIANLTDLRHLDLSRNQLTGTLPPEIGGLRQLGYLGLAGNRLADEIPASIAGCGELAGLRLGGNGLNGSIPQGLFDLGLEELDLSSNRLTGAIPAGSTRLFETLRRLDLSGNRLTGDIPPEMALYFNLGYLNLSWNDLRSRLPPELGYFRNLSVLDLRNSALYGPIPGDLCDSDSLAVLQLDGNSLTGPIPEEIGNCSSLYLLSLSHNNLNGSIPVAMSKLKKLKILNLEFNELGGEIPRELGGLDSLLAVNISHNKLIGRLPAGGVFPSLDQSAIDGNLGICSPLVHEPCEMNVPKPLVLDPYAYNNNRNSGGSGGGGGDNPAAVPHNAAARSRHRRFLSVSAIVAISAALVIVAGVLIISLLNVSARRRIGLIENALESMCSSSTRSAAGGPAATVGKLVLFGPRSHLRAEDLSGGAEALFHKATGVGRGVFGTVYKASVGGDGQIVAVKKLLTPNIVQYHDDFDREVRILGKARHPNLMPLKGYYWTPQVQLLISDYAPGGSLHSRLHDHHHQIAAAAGGGGESSTPPPLSWANRFKIALGTAKALAHLHQSFRPPIIHYNIKPSNILLDENCDPKVSDFGLARLLPKLDKHVISSRFQSALGYVAPEMACQSLRVNEKCDVYGYGVVVLELVTGRRPVEYGDDDVVILIDQVRVMLERGNVLECVDPAMGTQFPEEEVLPVLKLGLVCTSQIPSSRPSMAEVVQILQVIKTPVPDRMEAF